MKNKGFEEQDREQISQLLSQVADKGRLEEENKELRSQIVSGRVDRPLELVSVVGGGRGQLRLAAGKKAGVVTGMMVVSHGAVVGKVGSMDDWAATLLLPTNSDFKAAVIVRGAISGARRADGIVTGRNGRVLLTKALRSDSVSEGDVVVTAGVDGDLSGMIVGRITKVQDDIAGVYQEAVIEPPIRYEGLKLAFVVK